MPTDAPWTGQVCIANISPRERRKRLMAGVVQLAIALAILAVLVVIACGDSLSFSCLRARPRDSSS